MTYRWVSHLAILPLCSLLACQACQTWQLGNDATPANFDELLASLDNLSSQERQDRMADYVATFGPTPFVEGDEAIFVAQGEPSAPPRILGDFNAWGRNDEGPVESASRGDRPSSKRRDSQRRLDALGRDVPQCFEPGRRIPKPASCLRSRRPALPKLRRRGYCTHRAGPAVDVFLPNLSTEARRSKERRRAAIARDARQRKRGKSICKRNARRL